jgi:hypothetical protein
MYCMLPRFDEHGNLPPGIHLASVEEVVERFGSGSAEREVEIRELVELIDWARRHSVRRVIINGSFVTSKQRPNDVDLVVLPGAGAGNENVAIEFEPAGWPFLQILVAADDEDLERWATSDFATDREGRGKGVVEVIL